MQELIERNREKIAELCRQHHVRSLSVFGSAVRDDFDPERSDVDFAVEFDRLPFPESFDNRCKMKAELTALFCRPVDLIQVANVQNPYIRREIESQQENLYAA